MSTHNICFMGRGDANEYTQRMFLWAEAIVMCTHNICFMGRGILMSIHNICFMGRGDSNEYAQHMFYGPRRF